MTPRLALQSLLSAAVGAGLTALAMLSAGASMVPVESAPTANAPDGELLRLRAELAALRAAPEPNVREAAGGDAVQAAPAAFSSNAPTTAVDTVLLQRLLGELDEQRVSGPLASYFGTRPVELTEVLLRIWVETGAPQRAFRLLADVDAQLPELDNQYRLYVARALRDQKRPEALDAYLLVLAHDLGNRSALDDLAEFDAAGALTALQLRAQGSDLDDAQRHALQKERVRLLFAAGRKTEATTLLQSLLHDDQLGDDLLQRLIDNVPKVASEHLRRLLAKAGDGNEREYLRLLLARSLRSAGDAAAARAELEAVLADHPEDEGALQELAKIDPAAAEARLRQQFQNLQVRAESLRLARGLHALGKHEEAEALEWQEFTTTPGDTELQDNLLAANSLPLAERMLAHARALPSPPIAYDELLGNVADTLWRHGQTERAIALWRESRAIEPGDSEWTEKLASVAAGRDPLAPVRADWWRPEAQSDY